LSWKEGEKKDSEKKVKKRGEKEKEKKSVRKKKKKEKEGKESWRECCCIFCLAVVFIIIFTAVVIFTYILLSRATSYPLLMLVVLHRDIISVLGSRL